MPEIRIVHDYAQPPDVVWAAMTEPDLVARWTTTGRGGRPVGFQARVGCQFRYVAKPVPGWDGIVRCEVLEVNPPEVLRYSWQGGEKERPTDVLWRIEPHAGGTPADLPAHRVHGHHRTGHVPPARSRPPRNAQPRATRRPGRAPTGPCQRSALTAPSRAGLSFCLSSRPGHAEALASVMAPPEASMPVDTARAILHMARQGLHVVVVGAAPSASPGLFDAAAQDATVQTTMQALLGLPNVAHVSSEDAVPAALPSPEFSRPSAPGHTPPPSTFRRAG